MCVKFYIKSYQVYTTICVLFDKKLYQFYTTINSCTGVRLTLLK